MILNALVDYYDILAKEGKISRPGYCIANVSYALNLSEDGELISLMPLKIDVQRGKKTIEIPQRLEVPEQAKKSVNISANFLCGNSEYILGISGKDRPDRSKNCFDSFTKLHHTILDDVNNKTARAVLRFLDEWKPEKADECAILSNELDNLSKGVNIVFHISGIGYAQDDVEIRRVWELHSSNDNDSTIMQCLITGKELPIARLHPSIKGVRGGQPTGVSIVSFNDRAYESYGHDEQQGLNAPVSRYAAFAYTTVLNYLLSDNKYRQVYGDTTVVYWAESPKPIYRDFFAYSLDPQLSDESETSSDISEDKMSTKLLSDVFEKVMEGRAVAHNIDELFNPETRFFILGLSPNAARLSIRFFLQDSFGQILKNQRTHYQALEIERSPKDAVYLPLWKLMQETTFKDKASSPLLTGAVLRSILSGIPYPEELFSSIMLRIRAEHDVNRGKAAIIKAYLLRNKGNQYKEEASVSLNEQSNKTAYILGRLFSVLEKAQQDANPGINTTIKERYFTSACATPASVFPILLRLAGHHTSKAKFGSVSERRIRDLFDKLDVDNNPYPAHLNLPDQGLFILGYYHQKKANFSKKNEEE